VRKRLNTAGRDFSRCGDCGMAGLKRPRGAWVRTGREVTSCTAILEGGLVRVYESRPAARVDLIWREKTRSIKIRLTPPSRTIAAFLRVEQRRCARR